ncbi:hypothetical protein TanjilG_17510 [Lupinus angustifolius]|uniref:RRM domain-containing protein n=1 Tax=Lupinus angustifolius TaxID=3871 RepID=A0A4P1R208_LUPAN|nr:PREDICTED: RNA-binding protein 38-like [Lupinus angustifolius]OIV99700.1 hypothetical protein TanjilG_17510 [Lupinus angustifolius]
MTPTNMAGQFGDTTYTKVFVGGLAWETQKETMNNYFQQFGHILEAVVITDKATGRSKGYGFVTFREADAAMRACVDAAPVIDGRRANCNLASLGVQRSKPSTPKHGGGVRNFSVMGSFQTGFGGGGLGSAFASAATFPPYAIQQGIPYNLFGYSSYLPDYAYPASYYSVYGAGAAAQYPVYGSGGMMSGGGGGGGGSGGGAAFYPYVQYGGGEGTGYSSVGQGGYGAVNYPPHIFQYSPIAAASTAGHSSYAQHCATPISLAPSPAAIQSGVTMALQSPIHLR